MPGSCENLDKQEVWTSSKPRHAAVEANTAASEKKRALMTKNPILKKTTLKSKNENHAKVRTYKLKMRNFIFHEFAFPVSSLRFRVVIEGERGNHPRIYSLEQLLQEAVSFCLEALLHLLHFAVLWVVAQWWVA